MTNTPHALPPESPSPVLHISTKTYLAACLLISTVVFAAGQVIPPTPAVLAAEIFTVVIALFVFGSSRVRVDKNAVTYGAIPIIVTTYLLLPAGPATAPLPLFDDPALGHATGFDLVPLWFHGLERLIHLDTLLFLLGLTFFVNTIAQTQMPEAVALRIVAACRGRLFPAVLTITAGVSLASGVLDGVSMIGLTIRILVGVFAAAGVALAGPGIVVLLVMVIVTTVCGMWLAYGEPPNLIMKSILGLSDGFFLSYTLPLALIAFVIVAWALRRVLPSATISQARLSTMREEMARHALVPPDAMPAARRWGLLGFLPFVGMLIWHGQNPAVPLCFSALAGYATARFGLPCPARRAADREGWQEYQEYFFLVPLFLSIAFLTASGFFGPIRTAIVESQVGASHLAVVQFIASLVLSALLDNNVVADFAGRAIIGLPDMPLYAAAQIAGYATGGCLTHIGSAQSVVVYAYILRHIDPTFTPWQWIQAIWRVIFIIAAAFTAALYVMA